jgi:hypothetical protein
MIVQTKTKPGQRVNAAQLLTSQTGLESKWLIAIMSGLAAGPAEFLSLKANLPDARGRTVRQHVGVASIAKEKCRPRDYAKAALGSSRPSYVARGSAQNIALTKAGHLSLSSVSNAI